MPRRTFALKLKWRKQRPNGIYHCFTHVLHNPRRYESLCGNVTIKQSNGAVCARPDSRLRCARCDIEEMKLLGLDHSAEPSKNQ